MAFTMTPREKAKCLFDYYFPLCGHINQWEKAKQCALMCVEEILKASPSIPSMGIDVWEDLRKAEKYWKEVKAEIEKL